MFIKLDEIDIAIYFKDSFLKEISAFQNKGAALLRVNDDRESEDPVIYVRWNVDCLYTYAKS